MRKNNRNTRNQSVRVSLTPNEKNAIVKLAESHRESAGTYVRRILFQTIDDSSTQNATQQSEAHIN